MPRGFSLSLLLHGLVLLLITLGLPDFLFPKREIIPSAIVVEVLPISDITNVKPQAAKPTPPKQKPKPKPPEPKKPEKKPEPKPEPKKPVEEPVEVPEEDKKPKEEPEPKPEKKPEPKKEEPKEEPALEDILKDLAKEAETLPKPDKDAPKAIGTDYNPSLPLSASQIDDIRRQIAGCWNTGSFAGGANTHKMQVVLRLRLNPDGSVQEVRIVSDRLRLAADSFYRSFAESAVRAVKICSPLKRLDPGQYDRWKEIEMTFDPSMMLY